MWAQVQPAPHERKASLLSTASGCPVERFLFVLSPQAANPVLRFSEHQAAVKAIAWSPHQHGLLVSGGGTADRCIRFWNTTTGQSLQCIDTGSQVGEAVGRDGVG